MSRAFRSGGVKRCVPSTSYGFGRVSSVVLLAREAASKNLLNAASPASDRGVSSVPIHLPL